MRITVTSCIVASVGPLLLCGCGRSVSLGQVEGTVRLDGQPVNQVMVVFIPDDPHQPQSIGITDAEGRFQLRCNSAGLGAVVGEHRVTLVDAAVAPGGRSRDDDPPASAAAPASRLPSDYSRTDKTPLRRSVAPGSQTVDIDIASNRKPG
ncbi:MAG TPA: hypothetical protein VMR25_09145 [Planctomycetaceae bacterium]|jgi:hypothetical protein|nr:hypothetical protein [Planctomycetaceae bacterium]